VKEIVFLFAWSANTADRASNEHCHPDGYEDSRQKVAQARQVTQEIVHFKEPHSPGPLQEPALCSVVSLGAIIISLVFGDRK
jgi:hypothetical protein